MLLIFRQVVFYRRKQILEVEPPAPSRSLSLTFSKDCSILSVALLLIYIPLSKRLIKRMNHTTQSHFSDLRLRSHATVLV